MNVTNITDDYDNITSINSTGFDNMTVFICTNNEKKIDIIVPTLLITIPCGISFSCLKSFMVYTLVKILFNNNSWKSFYL